MFYLYSSDGAGRSATRRAFEIWVQHAQKGALISTVPGVVVGALFTMNLGAGVVVSSVASGAAWVVSAVWWLRKPSGAKRWLQGARAEIATARLLQPMTRQGWRFLHDLKVKSKRVKWQWDHMAVPASGDFLVYIDTKSWMSRKRNGDPQQVRWVDQQLKYGPWDNTSKLRTVEFEARRLAEETGMPVIPVIAVWGATVLDQQGVPSGFLKVGSTYVINTPLLPGVLERMNVGSDSGRAQQTHRALKDQFVAA